MKHVVNLGGEDVPVEAPEGGAGTEKVLAGGREVILEPGGARGDDPDRVVASLGPERLEAALLPPGSAPGAPLRIIVRGRIYEAKVESERDRLRALSGRPEVREARMTSRSTLPGIIRRILASPGDVVEEGTPLLTLEAMKMENEVHAEARGRVRAILVKEGQVVNAGDALVEIEPAP